MIFLAFLGIYCIFTLGQPWEKPRGNVNYIINSLRNGGKNGESHEDTDVVSCFSKEWIIPFYETFQGSLPMFVADTDSDTRSFGTDVSGSHI